MREGSAGFVKTVYEHKGFEEFSMEEAFDNPGPQLTKFVAGYAAGDLEHDLSSFVRFESCSILKRSSIELGGRVSVGTPTVHVGVLEFSVYYEMTVSYPNGSYRIRCSATADMHPDGEVIVVHDQGFGGRNAGYRAQYYEQDVEDALRLVQPHAEQIVQWLVWQRPGFFLELWK